MINAYDDPAIWGAHFREYNNGSIGTGVAIGDFDNDGRPDILVSYKTQPCRLYRNLGGFRFADVTNAAGLLAVPEEPGMIEGWLDAFSKKKDPVQEGLWNEGVAMADINNDGWLDLYICRFGAANLLYINQKNGTFREEAAARGLALVDSSVMAAFCDYDRDGKLDVLVQTNLLNASQQPAGRRNHLLHNRGDGHFEDVSVLLQPNTESQGHSCCWWDYDSDGWPDLYIANDFEGPDRLYRNIEGRAFENVAPEALPHTPYSSMGCDSADVDGDGILDLLVADMAARSHADDQRTLAPSRYSQKKTKVEGPRQVAQNALYLGTRTSRVREAAFISGLVASDWTWSARFEDFDEDGRPDLFVTTGMNREHHNLDLIARRDEAVSPREKVATIRNSPVFNQKNLAFHNDGNLHFTEVGEAWGLDDFGVSFGCATGDLDGDGDLDIVVTNFDRPPAIFRNESLASHRVLFALRGTESNHFGIGAIVRIATDDGSQVAELSSARGYQSTSEPVVHFGLGKAKLIRRVEVVWPTGKRNVWENLPADRKYTLEEKKPEAVPGRPSAQFVDVSTTGTQATPEPRPAKPMTHRLAPWRIEPRMPEQVDGALRPLMGETAPTIEESCREAWDLPEGVVTAFAASTLTPGGDLALFVGRRSRLGVYPRVPVSSLLMRSAGKWQEQTDAIAPGLRQVGNVTAALWSDVDNDGFPDLLVATEWGFVRCFRNEGGLKLIDATERWGFSKAGKGWWRSIAAADFNSDGRMDYIVGNVGENTQYRAAAGAPAVLYYGGEAQNGNLLIEAYYENGTQYPWRSRAELLAQIPVLGKKFTSNEAFAGASIAEIFAQARIEGLKSVEVTELRLGVFLSRQEGGFDFVQLPREAQLAPAQAIVCGDFNGDGNADAYIVQNSDEPTSTPWDGGVSQLLTGDGRGGFSAVPPAESGLVVGGATRAVAAFDANQDGWADFAVARAAAGSPVVFQNKGVAGAGSISIRFGGDGRPEDCLGARIEVVDSTGRRQIGEVSSHPGGVNRNQPVLFFGRGPAAEPVTVKVRWPDGRTELHRVEKGQSSLTLGSELRPK